MPYQGRGNATISIQFLVGLVTEQIMVEESSITLSVRQRLGLAVVINGALIREALDMLPSPTK